MAILLQLFWNTKYLYYVNIMWYFPTFKFFKKLNLKKKNKAPYMPKLVGQTKYLNYTFCKNSWEFLKKKKQYKQSCNNLSLNDFIGLLPGSSEKMHKKGVVFF